MPPPVAGGPGLPPGLRRALWPQAPHPELGPEGLDPKGTRPIAGPNSGRPLALIERAHIRLHVMPPAEVAQLSLATRPGRQAAPAQAHWQAAGRQGEESPKTPRGAMGSGTGSLRVTGMARGPGPRRSISTANRGSTVHTRQDGHA